ncbi:hypothetical protein PIIN_08921 [Serendipita indica DSM 11827]|uniref:Uncharacterized protein n=1 Tax=Serendipita indica (strain DSM 11827) TaxID=1109443 RepID=G4TUE8_SERID|nr:hypothetical protein PIIN_08921 [Serendipita indica DSM 11827]
MDNTLRTLFQVPAIIEQLLTHEPWSAYDAYTTWSRPHPVVGLASQPPSGWIPINTVDRLHGRFANVNYHIYDQDPRIVALVSLNPSYPRVPPYPGIPPPSFQEFVHPDCIFSDGSHGAFEARRYPQEFNPQKPWLPFHELDQSISVSVQQPEHWSATSLFDFGRTQETSMTGGHWDLAKVKTLLERRLEAERILSELSKQPLKDVQSLEDSTVYAHLEKFRKTLPFYEELSISHVERWTTWGEGRDIIGRLLRYVAEILAIGRWISQLQTPSSRATTTLLMGTWAGSITSLQEWEFLLVANSPLYAVFWVPSEHVLCSTATLHGLRANLDGDERFRIDPFASRLPFKGIISNTYLAVIRHSRVPPINHQYRPKAMLIVELPSNIVALDPPAGRLSLPAHIPRNSSFLSWNAYIFDDQWVHRHHPCATSPDEVLENRWRHILRLSGNPNPLLGVTVQKAPRHHHTSSSDSSRRARPRSRSRSPYQRRRDFSSSSSRHARPRSRSRSPVPRRRDFSPDSSRHARPRSYLRLIRSPSASHSKPSHQYSHHSSSRSDHEPRARSPVRGRAYKHESSDSQDSSRSARIHKLRYQTPSPLAQRFKQSQTRSHSRSSLPKDLSEHPTKRLQPSPVGSEAKPSFVNASSGSTSNPPVKSEEPEGSVPMNAKTSDITSICIPVSTFWRNQKVNATQIREGRLRAAAYLASRLNQSKAPDSSTLGATGFGRHSLVEALYMHPSSGQTIRCYPLRIANVRLNFNTPSDAHVQFIRLAKDIQFGDIIMFALNIEVDHTLTIDVGFRFAEDAFCMWARDGCNISGNSWKISPIKSVTGKCRLATPTPAFRPKHERLRLFQDALAAESNVQCCRDTDAIDDDCHHQLGLFYPVLLDSPNTSCPSHGSSLGHGSAVPLFEVLHPDSTIDHWSWHGLDDHFGIQWQDSWEIPPEPPKPPPPRNASISRLQRSGLSSIYIPTTSTPQFENPTHEMTGVEWRNSWRKSLHCANLKVKLWNARPDIITLPALPNFDLMAPSVDDDTKDPLPRWLPKFIMLWRWYTDCTNLVTTAKMNLLQTEVTDSGTTATTFDQLPRISTGVQRSAVALRESWTSLEQSLSATERLHLFYGRTYLSVYLEINRAMG